MFNGVPRFLRIKVGADPEMQPRSQLVTVPYALSVGSIECAAGGTLSGGLINSPTDFLSEGNAVQILDSAGDLSAAITVTPAGAAIIDFYDPVDSKGGRAGQKRVSIDHSGVTMFDTLTDTSMVLYPNGDIVGYGQLAMGDSTASTGQYSVALGKTKTVSGDYSVVGGYVNSVSGAKSMIAGGQSNVISTWNSAIAGGLNNEITGAYSFIGSGENNTVTGGNAAVIGGYGCLAGPYAIAGGSYDTASGGFSVALGSYNKGDVDRLVAVQGSRIVGTVVYRLEPRTLHFMALAVDPSYARQGIAGNLWRSLPRSRDVNTGRCFRSTRFDRRAILRYLRGWAFGQCPKSRPRVW
ncbi:MAG: GNAT family N-acetyltransferase [bacterium]